MTDNADPVSAVTRRHRRGERMRKTARAPSWKKVRELAMGAGDGSGSGRCDDDVASVENDGDNNDDDRDI